MCGRPDWFPGRILVNRKSLLKGGRGGFVLSLVQGRRGFSVCRLRWWGGGGARRPKFCIWFAYAKSPGVLVGKEGFFAPHFCVSRIGRDQGLGLCILSAMNMMPTPTHPRPRPDYAPWMGVGYLSCISVFFLAMEYHSLSC